LQFTDQKFVNVNSVFKNRLAATLLAALFNPDQQASIVTNKNVLGGF